MSTQSATRLPISLKLAYTAFVAVHVFVNWRAYGPLNFLWMCDVAVLMLAAALWLENRLLLSTAAVGILVPLGLWGVDLAVRLLSGHYWLGFAGYMFDRRVPAAVRVTSTFHVWLPVVLGWALWRLGYDRRALAVQCVLIALLLVICRTISAPPPRHELHETVNVNWVYGLNDDAAQTALPGAVYLGLIVLGYQLLFYVPTHFVLAWAFKANAAAPGLSQAARKMHGAASSADNHLAWLGGSTSMGAAQ